MKIWLNGSLSDENASYVLAHNAGSLLGWGVFSTIGIVNGRATWLERHFRRLRHDAAALDLVFSEEDEVLFSALTELIQANDVQNGLARLTVTARGDNRWNHASGYDLSILAISAPAAPLHNLKLCLSPHRLDARRPLAGIKSTSYAPHQWLWHAAQQQGFDEAVVLNQKGIVCEGARSNLFWVRKNELFTPETSTGCLPGIGREIILGWARERGWNVHEGSFSLLELEAADEVFLTTATTGPRSVALFATQSTLNHANQYPSPGPMTEELQHRWQTTRTT